MISWKISNRPSIKGFGGQTNNVCLFKNDIWTCVPIWHALYKDYKSGRSTLNLHLKCIKFCTNTNINLLGATSINFVDKQEGRRVSQMSTCQRRRL